MILLIRLFVDSPCGGCLNTKGFSGFSAELRAETHAGSEAFPFDGSPFSYPLEAVCAQPLKCRSLEAIRSLFFGGIHGEGRPKEREQGLRQQCGGREQRQYRDRGQGILDSGRASRAAANRQPFAWWRDWKNSPAVKSASMMCW